jgi:hypothetical protein
MVGIWVVVGEEGGMRYTTIQGLKDDEFRRLTGVKRKTFEGMVVLLSKAKAEQKVRGGRPHGLMIEEQLLMMLSYWREYRTYFHIGQTYGKSESQTYRIIRWCEETLVKSQAFRLPGRQAVVANERAFDVVLIDATETPIERPKKSSGSTTQEKRSGIRSKRSWLSSNPRGAS